MGQCPIASGLFEDRKLVAKYVIDREDDYIRMQYHHIDYHIFPDVEVYFCPIVLFNYRKNERLQNKFGSGMDGNKNRNKIKLKKNVAKSGMGLKNLSARYLLICNLHITIIDDSEYFTVKIPLLNE